MMKVINALHLHCHLYKDFCINLSGIELYIIIMSIFKNQHFKCFLAWKRCSGYHYCTSPFNKAWTQVLLSFQSCLQRDGDSQCWESLAMVSTISKVKHLSSVNHTTKTIHYQKCYKNNYAQSKIQWTTTESFK